jgi:cytochrome c oxidase cbb3-type subunit I/II
MYIWAGPHHLLNTALPEWAQSLGMVFSLMLWAPSWGGMLNGLLTLRGAWQKLREDPVLKFFAAGVTFYGMATFEGPLLSIKSVSALAHYTDWIIGHVHSGALGWNGFMAAGMFYWLVPRLYGTKLHSTKAADAHFWLATLGIILYIIAMWVSSAQQGMMVRATNPDGTLVYPSWVETVVAIRPMYMVRALGGSMYLAGFVMMTWNLVKTARAGKPVTVTTEVAVEEPGAPQPGIGAVLAGRPLWFSLIGVAAVAGLGVARPMRAVVIIGFVALLGELAWILAVRDKQSANPPPSWFGIIERKPLSFTVLTLIAILIGGMAELLPTLLVKQAVPAHSENAQKPYTALELQGRDLYVREGCYTCHSQMVRSLTADTARFGDYSKPEEFIYDHPFQWGSKRTGPDLHRLGGRYPSLWHYAHLMDPRSTSPGSNMPSYRWLEEGRVDAKLARPKLALMQKLGVPYTNAEVDAAEVSERAQADAVVTDLASQGVTVPWDSEVVALISYLQRLGRDVGVKPLGKEAPVATAVPAAGGQ